MIRRPPGSTRTDTLFPYTTLFRSSVVGVPGAGKSTVGRELARRLGSRFVELDSIHHQPGWTPLPREPFRARVAEELEADTWVVDGNYSAVQEDRKSTRLNSSH